MFLRPEVLRELRLKQDLRQEQGLVPVHAPKKYPKIPFKR